MARQEPRPPIFPVPRPTTLFPLKVGAHFLRHQLRVETRGMDCLWLCHQLRTKVRSMVCFRLRHQLQVKTRNMNGFGCVINYGLKSVA